MNCPNCGVKVDPGVRFCYECGAEINEPVPAEPQVGVPSPQYGPPPPPSPGKNLSIASLVLGIVSVVLSLMTCIPFVNYCTCAIMPILALVGLALGIVGVSQAGPGEKGQATWGIILSVTSILIGVAIIVLYMLGIVSLGLLQNLEY